MDVAFSMENTKSDTYLTQQEQNITIYTMS